MDVEDIRKCGERVCGCPYYATRGAAEEADVLLMPYTLRIFPIVFGRIPVLARSYTWKHDNNLESPWKEIL